MSFVFIIIYLCMTFEMVPAFVKASIVKAFGTSLWKKLRVVVYHLCLIFSCFIPFCVARKLT